MGDKTLAFTAMALMVPTIEAGMNTNWLTVLVAGLSSSLLLITQQKIDRVPRLILWLRRTVMLLIAAWVMRRTGECWSGDKANYVVPAVLTILALMAEAKGTEATESACAVLRYGMYMVFGMLLTGGLKEIRWNTVKPEAQLPGEELILTMMLPLLSEKNETKKNVYWIIALLASVVGRGTEGIYANSKGISISGLSDHVESLVACAVTIGYYGLLCWTMERMVCKGWKLCAMAFIAYTISIMKIEVPIALCAGMIAVLWYVIPVGEEIKRKLKKDEKSA